MVYGARLIAEALRDLGVKVIFSLPGLPVIDIGNEAMKLGIRYLCFRNEQAAVYAATAYGYLTGRPGVCVVVGGPGVIHAMAGLLHAEANAWPLLLLGGSSEMHNAGKGAFQEVDAVSLFTPHTKLAVRPHYVEQIKTFINDAYRTALFGRPGATFVDLPANFILGHFDVEQQKLKRITEVPLPAAPATKVQRVAETLKAAKAPLVIIGKGAAYARAEKQISNLINTTHMPFLPTPMGKGVVPDSSDYNISSARSTALKEADVILVLGARLNWILSFGKPPKWNPSAKIIQVDLNADDIGVNTGDSTLGLVGDIALAVDQLIESLDGWRWSGTQSPYYRKLQEAKSKNETKASKKAAVGALPMKYEKAFDVIKRALHRSSNPTQGDIVYVSEGANAMDISRSIFPMEHPRIRLDAGTYATMGVGLGYAIAAFAAYNFSEPEGSAGSHSRKKIVAIEGDSAFGFSGMEFETMVRYKMDVLIFLLNNSGLYQGDANTREKWNERQTTTVEGRTAERSGLSAQSLGYETDYHKLAEALGGTGMLVRTPEELEVATERGFKATGPVIINIIIDTDSDAEMDFSWLDMAPPKKDSKL